MKNFNSKLIADMLKSVPDNCNFCGIFQTIGCIGDSLLSGAFEIFDKNGEKQYIDCPQYSWGKYIEKALGNKVHIFAKGGMTARDYRESFAETNGFWDKDKSCQAYIIALGINDLFYRKHPLGTVKDIDINAYNNNALTITGCYAYIIQRYKEIQPDANFFIMTLPKNRDNENPERSKMKDLFSERLYQIAELFSNVYVMDFRKFAPIYDKEFEDNYFLGDSHMNPMGYILTAKMVMMYIVYIIKNNINDFKYAGFIGTGIEYKK